MIGIKTTFDPSIISKYRTPLMGLAMIWVLLNHLPLNMGEVPFLVRIICRSGYGGVDLFFFLSGLGIYFSYRSSKDIKEYLKKRALRILPYCLPIVVGYAFFFLLPNGEITLKGAFVRIFMLEYWVEQNALGWYIPVAILFYLLTPLLMKLLDKGSFSWGVCTLYSVLALALGVFLYKKFGFYNHMNDTIRLGVYILGLKVGKLIADKKTINVWFLILALVVGFTLYALNYLYMYQHGFIAIYFRVIPYAIMSFPLCALFAVLFSLIRNYKFPILTFIGTYTLCIYLFHERAMEILIFYNFSDILITPLLITFPVAYLWQNGISKLMSKIPKANK